MLEELIRHFVSSASHAASKDSLESFEFVGNIINDAFMDSTQLEGFPDRAQHCVEGGAE